MRLLAAALLALLATACGSGGGDAAATSTGAAATGRAPAPAPTVVPPGPGGMPPAFVETPDGRVRLAFGTSCYRGACVDYVAPTARDDIPTVSVPRGTLLTLRLPFRTGADVTVGGRAVALPDIARRVVRFRAESGGLVDVFVRAPDGGDATYHLHLRVTA